ncbi:PIN domain-containing protein [Hypericibacter adhaerens]|nr:PIN domain-containing protein [Hypericibacter adhaerens]
MRFPRTPLQRTNLPNTSFTGILKKMFFSLLGAAMAIEKLLFVDTNIWLDFYRARSDAGLALLKHLEAIADRIIVTHQLEMEFKKNRQRAIVDGMQELKPPVNISRPGIFSDAQAVKSLSKSLKTAEANVKKLKQKLGKALKDPAAYDPVYQACQRIFHRQSDLVLTRENPIRRSIRTLALRRFLHGCPPRKKDDTSMGDAINWEWMIHCAIERTAELVIVTRDSDYGLVIDNTPYINDHLRQEFGDRVSQKRKILLYTKLSDALKHFKVEVTPAEKIEEEKLLSKAASPEGAKTEEVLDALIGLLKAPAKSMDEAKADNANSASEGLLELLRGLWPSQNEPPATHDEKGPEPSS